LLAPTKCLKRDKKVENKINFGTDGIRGHADQYPFTEQALINLGIAIALWGISKYEKEQPALLIGHDTRESCTKIKKALKKGLSNFPLKIVDAEILPTPAVCQIINKSNNFDFGIIISASHNPYQDNGIKIIDAETIKLNTKDEDLIIKNFETISESKHKFKASAKAIDQKWNDAHELYKKHLFTFFNPNFLQDIKVVLDCANGATYKLAPEIFKAFGAQTTVLFTQPNGKNINYQCGSLHPEKLQEAILENKADVGFAFDGDGDRVIAVNRHGQIIEGDDILALLSEHPKVASTKTIVGTIMSNLGLELHLKKEGKHLIRTQVGDKYISAQLQENNLLLGGENSGHIIIKDYMNSGDGIFVALKLLETILITKNWNIKLFEKIPQILINVPVLNKKDLTLQPYAKIINEQEQILKKGRIIVRYSGTEKLLRVMVEEQDNILANNVAKTLVEKLKNALDQNL
jgi:phosphoglucosamine mutase